MKAGDMRSKGGSQQLSAVNLNDRYIHKCVLDNIPL